jgi:pyrroloquinoline quinone biosynthesis protein B
VRAVVLGSAAGGGFPQWNCNCRVCRAARDADGHAVPRAQSSVAVRGREGPWFLLNASPDLRAQLTLLPIDRSDGIRATAVGGVVFTDGEIDHTAGLLLLRESSAPIPVYSTDEVRHALTAHYPLLPMLARYCGLSWTEVKTGERIRLESSSLEIESFSTGGDPPLYVGEAAGPESIGLVIRDGGEERTLTYAPAVAAYDDEIRERFEASDCVLVDGTFWTNDELVVLGISTRDARAMGHAPLSGGDGTLESLSALRSRVILVHVNNTNPILLDDSEERATVEASGIEVSYDGMEIEI